MGRHLGTSSRPEARPDISRADVSLASDTMGPGVPKVHLPSTLTNPNSIPPHLDLAPPIPISTPSSYSSRPQLPIPSAPPPGPPFLLFLSQASAARLSLLGFGSVETCSAGRCVPTTHTCRAVRRRPPSSLAPSTRPPLLFAPIRRRVRGRCRAQVLRSEPRRWVRPWSEAVADTAHRCSGSTTESLCARGTAGLRGASAVGCAR